ncbi:uncharacterized protein LOC103696925 isoform X1 [Phoenix dactylifera]|uniref:Uncharacterized protein LOC103696925 isoform X1 n=1 Tax=Phoenix dactylifera TaxID=42345 RepID=A0A8B8ZTG2_PHODC|nr:uncharacterized protein LOC103696925 isoform X1 [Phoenix dactylifera]
MAGASRLLRTSRALQSDHHPPFSSSSSNFCRLPCPKFLTGRGAKSILPQDCRGRKRVPVSPGTAVTSPEKKHEPSFFEKGMEIMDLSSSRVAQVAKLALTLFVPSRQEAPEGFSSAHSEMLVETGIAGCQSFTLIAVAGSLIGSVLCFVEGCFLVLEAFFQYFHMISQRLAEGGIIQLLIEAIDTFLVGTALLTFGMGLYVMFSGSADTKQNRGWQIAESSLGSFNLQVRYLDLTEKHFSRNLIILLNRFQMLAKSMEMQSISEAKSKIGHAILLILQTGMLEKFKNVTLASGLDLACFAGAVFISSACVFLLSKLTMQRSKSAWI